MTEMERGVTDCKATGQQVLAAVQQLLPVPGQVGRITTVLQRMSGTFPYYAAAAMQRGAAGVVAPQQEQQQPAEQAAAKAGTRRVNRAGRRAAADVPFASSLSDLPSDLYVLWKEYTRGIGGRKPAKDFTYHERGAVKYNYSRRKVVWDQISELVRAGDTAEVAIDRIYNIYGRRTSVTNIINRLRTDRMNGGPAALHL
jgi:nucleoid-associated protein YgaU